LVGLFGTGKYYVMWKSLQIQEHAVDEDKLDQHNNADRAIFQVIKNILKW